MSIYIKRKEENKKWNFEGYSHRATAIEGLPTISIYKLGMINLTAGFTNIAKQEIKACKYARLFYDKSSNSVGIKFTNEINVNGNFKITSVNKTTKSFSGRSFFNYYSIDISKVIGSYVASKEYINEKIGYLWVIKLKTKGEISDDN